VHKAIPRLVSLVVAVVAVAAAGCGSSSDDSTSTNASPATAATTASAKAATGTPIKIGMVFTGGSAAHNAPDYVTAVKAGASALNQAGGIKGHPVKVVSCNDNADPNKAQECARQMVDAKVVSTIANLSAGNPVGVAQVLDKGGIPQIALLANTKFEFSCKTCWPFDANQIGVSAGDMQGIKNAGGKSVYIAGLNLPQTLFIAAYAKKALAPLGLKLAGEVQFPFNQADYAPIAAKIKSANPDYTYLPVGENNALQLIKALTQVGYQGKYAMSTGVLTEADFKKLGQAVEGTVIFGGTPPFSASNVQGVQTFNDQMKAAQAAGDSAANPENMTVLALQAWAAFQGWTQIAKGLSAWTPADLQKGLAAQTTPLDMQGITKDWAPGKSAGVTDLPQISNPTGWHMTVKNGLYELVDQQPDNIGTLLG
jgi:ABC-type branched-subunit amino acid transport system substrate-binding protein